MMMMTMMTTTEQNQKKQNVVETAESDFYDWKRHPRQTYYYDDDTADLSTLSQLHDHDCLMNILQFLSWQDLNTFALVSKKCRNIRRHSSLDQTRSGTIILTGKPGAVSNSMELMDVVRERQWPTKVFTTTTTTTKYKKRCHRTHLRLIGLMHLSSYIEPINEDFIRQNVAPLLEVTSLDCSCTTTSEMSHHHPHHSQKQQQRQQQQSSSSWLSSLSYHQYGDYIDKGFAHGLAISLLVPNLRQIDMSGLPLTLLGVDWLLQTNSNLEIVQWNQATIWPINSDACDHIQSCQNLKEVYLQDSRMILCGSCSNDNDNDNDNDDWNPEELWTCLAENCQQLQKVSVKGVQYFFQNEEEDAETCGRLLPIPQEHLIKFVRCTPSLSWFCSDLSEENIAMLQKERPNLMFCRY